MDALAATSLNFPVRDDLLGAVRGLMFLQDTYDFDIEAATRL